LCAWCVIIEYRFGQSDEVDDDDEADHSVGLSSGIYGRGVQSKHYMSFTAFDNVENVSVCVSYFLKICQQTVHFTTFCHCFIVQ